MAVIQGGTSGVLADVDANKALQVVLPTDPNNAGYAKLLDSNGDEILTTENGALDMSQDNMILYEQVEGSALNVNVWSTSVLTMAIAQANGFITLNSAAITTINTYAILSSQKSIPLYGALPFKIQINLKVNTLPEANATMEVGIGTVATTAAPTDGCFFRWNSSAELRAIINNNGSEIASVALSTSLIPVNTTTLLGIVVVEDLVQFFVDDVLVAENIVAAANAFPTNAGRLPIFARTYTGGSAPATAPQISIGQVLAVQQAMNQNKMWGEIQTLLGRGCYQSPVTTFDQTANHANSTSPTSATLSNTAAGYTTLGGRWQFAAPAGAATDFALFGFQVPAGYQLIISAIKISSMNTGAVVTTTATILDWSLAVNSSAVSLATTQSPPTSYAPKRIPLGTQGFVTGAGIGQSANELWFEFLTPIVCDGGRFVHIIVQVPVGTATASQVIRGDVTICGYFE